jgi:hypothetical protein
MLEIICGITHPRQSSRRLARHLQANSLEVIRGVAVAQSGVKTGRPQATKFQKNTMPFWALWSFVRMNDLPPKRLMSSAAAMRVMGVSKETIERLAKSGRDGFPKAIKVGRVNYFSVEAVEAFIKRAQENKGIKRRRAENAADYVEVLA